MAFYLVYWAFKILFILLIIMLTSRMVIIGSFLVTVG